MIRVLIVDDAPLTLSNIERLLRNESEMDPVGSVGDGESAITMTRELHPDVVIMDMDLQRGDGLRATQVISKELPATAVIVMGLDDDPGTQRMVTEAGARDYIVKPFGAAELLEVIRRVHGGEASPNGDALVAPLAPPAPPAEPEPFSEWAPAAAIAPIAEMSADGGDAPFEFSIPLSPTGASDGQDADPAPESVPDLAPAGAPPSLFQPITATPAPSAPSQPSTPGFGAPEPNDSGAANAPEMNIPDMSAADVAAPDINPPAQAGSLNDFAASVGPSSGPGAGQPTRTAIHTVAIVAAKGGVGTSVLAVNLALLASAEARKRSALIELDIQHGSARRLLRIEPIEGILEVATASPEAAPDQLAPRMAPGPAGLIALLGPAQPRPDVALQPEFIEALMQQLRGAVDFAVFDVPSHLTAASAAALRNADRVVVLSSMTDPGVRATQGLLGLLKDMGLDMNHVLLVLNRNEANSDLTKAAVEEAVGHPVAVQLPYDPILVSTAINRGAPFVLQKPDAQVSRKVRELGSFLFPIAMLPEPVGTQFALDVDEDESRPRRKKKGFFSFGKE